MTTENTWYERYAPAMTIVNQEDADRYLERLVADQLEAGLSHSEAMKVERSNLGYFAGYYGNETREQVERLFRCEHPYFGSILKNGPPNAKKAFEAGMRLGHDYLTARDRFLVERPIMEEPLVKILSANQPKSWRSPDVTLAQLASGDPSNVQAIVDAPSLLASIASELSELRSANKLAQTTLQLASKDLLAYAASTNPSNCPVHPKFQNAKRLVEEAHAILRDA